MRCLVAWRFGETYRIRGDYTDGDDFDDSIRGSEPITLEDALGFVHAGAEIILDPFDYEDLIRWEQIERSMRENAKWRKW